ncbi:MAG: glutamate formimidoyltransferase [Gemmatimonadetes bacterium]|uniref:Formimidoyltransferase-cyclodeaminase n=1 Tax=Candidatus Kutchimonas denitrificans TaxID=3056748 RepID=A0AAE4ZCX0_9BACT|nr:glutamate formimidoyltransferase [Gemmatimonadota bacterium]NIR76316.1 glutamate formimidoyltransferase [Candidatus Kutchimonas denitrificans]NIS02339.1 glutamate formimidoyltransferase [Gemmatimonadota bacterium]NIT68158.1 glutamate formimidoyltransferase [Gemmatimonadota bacterium]NIU54382.1 glutamate formimidoyltransferase [Gemmatimonadota bacterium]
MEKIVECVPNFSEGRNDAVIQRITDAIEAVSGVRLLDVDPGRDTNRTVVTFVGSPEAVEEAAFRAVERAAEVIDMREHQGAHPRFGATDVCPFVPVAGVSMEDCVEIARRVGARIGEELEIPVYLYEAAASRPERRNLARVRAGEYEGLEEKLGDPEWKPDFGPARMNPTAGATAVGAREFLIAYNIDLNTMDRRYANEIAYVLRERGRWKRVGNTEPFYYKGEVVRFPEDGTYPCGPCDFVGGSFEELERHYREAHGGDLGKRYEDLGIDPENPSGPVFIDGLFTHVKGIGWVIEDYKRAQISMNLTDYKVAAPHQVLEAARSEAAKRGIVITGSEIVGVIPYAAMREAAVFYLRRMRKSTGLPVPDLMETAIQSMGLRDVAPFDPEEKVLAMPRVDGPLVNRSTYDFVDEVSRDTPAPGGGSVAALAGALGGALAGMVANLSVGKGEFDAQYEELCSIAERAQQVKDALVVGVDDDTSAFDQVIDAMRMPRDTEEERQARQEAMQEGYKAATRVPLKTVRDCRDALALCVEMAELADPEMVSDVGTGAHMAAAGAHAAAYNVRINLRHIGDEDFNAEMSRSLSALIEECEALKSKAVTKVDAVLAASTA